MTDIEFKKGDEVTMVLDELTADRLNLGFSMPFSKGNIIHHVPAPEPRKFVARVWRFSDGHITATVNDTYIINGATLLATATITEGEGL